MVLQAAGTDGRKEYHIKNKDEGNANSLNGMPPKLPITQLVEPDIGSWWNCSWKNQPAQEERSTDINIWKSRTRKAEPDPYHTSISHPTV